MNSPDTPSDEDNHNHKRIQDLITYKRGQIALFAGYMATLQEIANSEHLLSEIDNRIDAMNDIFWSVNSREINTHSSLFRYMLEREHTHVSSGRKSILL